MFKFGKSSLAKLAGCHPDIQRVFNEAIKESPYDFGISCGFRGEAEQNSAYADGRSKLKFPQSKHNKNPSQAVDILPFLNGVNIWKLISDRAVTEVEVNEVFTACYNHINETARAMGVYLRWGGDFNGDGDKTTKDAWDKPHYELRD